MTEPTARRRMSLNDLRNDLAQVAPAETEQDLDMFASELRSLLAGSQTNREKTGGVIDKAALWDRVSAEIDRHEADPTGDPATEEADLFLAHTSIESNPTEPTTANDPA